ncbi:MAG: DUF4136 domain-containing protein [Gammaproteobacteria bacterium]|nr:DUF4136 domain-containing protein [Gammaproteobacteria bacterium]
MNTLLKTIILITAFTSFLITSGCSTLTGDIEIETHDLPESNYGTYKTYAWAGSAQIVFDPIGQWEQPTLNTDEEVKFNINRELRSKGMYEVQDNPDLLVAFAAGVDMSSLELKQTPSSNKDILTNVPKAALVVALVDTKTGYMVWLGLAEGDVQEQQSINNIRKRIDYAITEMFRRYNGE